DPTNDLALTGLSMGERTGSRVLQWVWSYVVVQARVVPFKGRAGPEGPDIGILQD
ncbi:hypothetical protein B0T16DRAFT_331301, partial [Cercophora newfieldiana]